MVDVKIIEIKEELLGKNNITADNLRCELKKSGTFLLNVMSSPGSGKTTTIINLINKLKDKLNIAVMEADIDSDVDAKLVIEKCGIESIQIHTGGMCHLDSEMTKEGLDGLVSKDLDLVILENIGNLVCPCEFDTGAIKNICILSVPEGDDKPLKYPLMFSSCDAIVVNKIDTIDCFDFSYSNVEKYVHELNEETKIFYISAKSNIGVSDVAMWLLDEVNKFKNKG